MAWWSEAHGRHDAGSSTGRDPPNMCVSPARRDTMAVSRRGRRGAAPLEAGTQAGPSTHSQQVQTQTHGRDGELESAFRRQQRPGGRRSRGREL